MRKAVREREGLRIREVNERTRIKATAIRKWGKQRKGNYIYSFLLCVICTRAVEQV